MVLLIGYSALFVKIWRSRRRRGNDARTARLYAFFCVLAKFPQMAPQLEQAPDEGLGRLRLFAYLAKKMPFLEQVKAYQTADVSDGRVRG